MNTREIHMSANNSLDELGIPKNPHFDPSHDSVASFSRFLELLKFVCHQIKG